jgi:glutaminyl-tRNA synthetase
MNFIEEKILEKGKLDKLKLRFPPEPNSASGLHLGHAKSICLNFGLAEKYNAPCVLRFDDTNPTTEKTEYVESIIKDVEWLGFKPSEIKFTSDYFDFIYDCAIILIKKGLAYVDESTSEEIAKMKGTPTKSGINSPFRNRSIEENLNLFERMKAGEFKEGSMTLRAKIDMSHSNMILRDPVIYRIIEMSHHRTGDSWKIYPMYDFAHPLSDYIEGVSDSLCTLEFEVHRPLYEWILNNCDLTGDLPEETEFARLNVDSTVMSKRKINALFDNGILEDIDDPRLSTIAGLRRRGFTPSSIREFCDRVGVTKRESLVSYSLLEEILRNELNKSSNRLMGVFDPVKVVITNWNEGVKWCEVENNPEDEKVGKRLVPFTKEIWIEKEDFREEANNKYNRLKLGGEVRLKGAFVIKANSVIKDELDNITEIHCTYDPESASGKELDRKIKGTIHWVSCDHGVKFKVNEYDKLFNVDAPSDNFLNEINEKSLIVNESAIFEPEIKNLKFGLPVQMMRKGYYVLDEKSNSLNSVVSLKEGWKG